MGILKFLEKKAFLGEVLVDYGRLCESQQAGSSVVCDALLCERGSARQLVLRETRKALLGGAVSYSYIELTPSSLAKLREIVADLERRT